MSGEGTPTPFIELPTAYRVFAIEDVTQRLRQLMERIGKRPTPDLPLDTASETWLRRMRSALVDIDCTQQSFDELNAAFEDFLTTRPEVEARDLRGRLATFAMIRDAIPLEATDAGQATIQAVLDRLRDRAEARA